MKKRKTFILAIDVLFNLVSIVFCLWRIYLLLQSDLQKMIEEEGGIGAVNQLMVVGAVVLCLFLAFDIVTIVGRVRGKESIIGEGMIGVSFFVKIICVIGFAIFNVI